jgi:hypothetical protein
MRSAEADRICGQLTETGEAVGQVLQVEGAFLGNLQTTAFPLRVTKVPISEIGREQSVGPFGIFRGPDKVDVASFDSEEPGPPLPSWKAWNAALDGYRGPMVTMGLPLPRTWSDRPVEAWAVEGSPSALTRGFLWGAQGLRRLGEMGPASIPLPPTELAPRVKEMAQAFVATVVGHPDSLILPAGTYHETVVDGRVYPVNTFTRTQADGLGRLSAFWQDRSMRPYADRAEQIVGMADSLPDIDTGAWTHQLRHRLELYTREEHDGINELLAASAEHAATMTPDEATEAMEGLRLARLAGDRGFDSAMGIARLADTEGVGLDEAIQMFDQRSS